MDPKRARWSHWPTLGSPVVIVATAVPVHVLLAACTELSPDEAYYAVAGSLGGAIPDHPPLVTWLARVASSFGWLPLELRVRLPAVVLSAALALGLVWLTKQEAGRRGCAADEVRRAVRTAALLATWLPLPAAGGFLMTPDVAASAGWIAALAWGSGLTSGRWWRELGAAAIVAMGVLAKVSVFPAAVVAVAARATVGRARPNGTRPRQALQGWGQALSSSLILLLIPILTWQLFMPSLMFQWHHAFGPAHANWPRISSAAAVASLSAIAASVGSVVGLFSPPVIWLGVRALPKLRPVYGMTTLAFTALVLASACWRGLPVEPNWWLPAALPVLVGASIASGRMRRCRGARMSLAAAVVVPTILALIHAVHPFLPIATRLDPTARLHGWRSGVAPSEAPGVGPYGVAAERCVYQSQCEEISSYINDLAIKWQK